MYVANVHYMSVSSPHDADGLCRARAKAARPYS
jgi:hypothetical protein